MKTKHLLTAFLLIIISTIMHADGFIIIDPQANNNAGAFPLEIRYHRVDVKINNQTSTTNIDQVFYNPLSIRLEGYYFFPIPVNAIIKKFSMYINGKETEAELLDAKKAKDIYEEIVRKQKDPAILEYSNRNLYRVRIFPIDPRSEKRIKISYSEVLNIDNGTYEYIYPLNTEKFSSKPLLDVSINIDLQTNDKIKNIFSTSHEVEIIRKNENQARISYEANNIKPDKDFKLYYDTQNSKVGLSVVTYKEKGQKGFFLLNIAPDYLINNNEIVEKDISFVLDTSGSMAGNKLMQAKKALNFCIDNLNTNDRFEIIRFSTEAESLFNNLEKADNANISKAKNFIENLKPIGGTDIEDALKLALSKKHDNLRPYLVIFITDGKPTIGETDDEKLLVKIKDANLNNTRIFTFGIGDELNIHLLDKITEAANAFRTYISTKEDIENKISNFYMKVQSPVLSSIKITYSNIKATNLYPKEIPDLFKGSSISIIGQYEGSGLAKIILEGILKNKTEKFEYEINFYDANTKDESIPALWAARRVGYLLDQIRLHGEEKELIEEVTDLAKKYGIITPYTSYLILEDENNRQPGSKWRIFNNSASNNEDIINKTKDDYDQMKKESGEKSIQASEEIQSLNNARSFGQIKQDKYRLEYKDENGNTQNLLQNVKNIAGRAVYFLNNFLVDSLTFKNSNLSIIKIKFASNEYFEFLRNNPDVSMFLSLGKNLRFVFNNKIYEIY